VFHLHCTPRMDTTSAVFGHLGCLIFDLLLTFTCLFLSSSAWPQSEEMKAMLQETKTHPNSSFLFVTTTCRPLYYIGHSLVCYSGPISAPPPQSLPSNDRYEVAQHYKKNSLLSESVYFVIQSATKRYSTSPVTKFLPTFMRKRISVAFIQESFPSVFPLGIPPFCPNSPRLSSSLMVRFQALLIFPCSVI